MVRITNIIPKVSNNYKRYTLIIIGILVKATNFFDKSLVKATR